MLEENTYTLRNVLNQPSRKNVLASGLSEG
nr:MAG TPA_asm: hypothetical protein [Caudoviricetes sp.]